MARKKKQYAVRLDPDTSDRIDEYAEEKGVTDAETLRRLIRDGLDESEQSPEEVATIRRLNYGLVAGFTWLLAETAFGLSGALLIGSAVPVLLLMIVAVAYPALQGARQRLR